MSKEILRPTDIREALRRGRAFLWIEGIAMCIAGLFAIAFPLAAGLAIERVLAVIALVVGGISMVRALTGCAEHAASTFGTGLLAVLLGLALLLWPIPGLEAVVLLIAAFCLLRGIADVMGVPARSNIAPGVQIFTGLASVVLGVLLLIWFPTDVLWAPGTLFGIELLFLALPVLAVANAVSVQPAGRPTATDS
jgi:uncharacterized membrane protein HdeD (DUF308 family)